MDLNRLRLFQVVCEEGSVSRAAVRLFRTQPAISMQLATLEAEARTRLLSRRAHGVTPTPEGLRLLACAAELFRAEDRMKESWFADPDGGDLRLAASGTVTRHLLPGALRAAVRQRPALRLHLTEAATPTSLNLLESGQVDLGFLLLPLQAPRLCHEVVLRYRHVAAYPRGMRATAPIEPAELVREPLVLLARGTQTRHLVDEAFRSRGIMPSRVIEVGSVSIQKELIRCGLGVGIVPEYAVTKTDRLAVRRIVGATERKIAVAWRSDLPLTGTVELFLTILREAAKGSGRSGKGSD